MNNSKVIPIQQVHNTMLNTAIVTAVIDDSCCEINYAGACYNAQVMYSCLVKPMVDDVVMCVMTEHDIFYISGIVERRSEKSMTLGFSGSVTFASAGQISLHSADSVTLAAADSINCLSKKALHKSDSAIVNYDDLTMSGAIAKASYTTVRVFSQMINTISNQVMQKFKNYTRNTEEMDQVKSSNMNRRVEGLYSMSNENAVMLSKKDIKIDAEHIHMG